MWKGPTGGNPSGLDFNVQEMTMASTAASIPQRRAPAQPDLRSWSQLPSALLERLTLEGIRSPNEWRALGKTRFRIFGITRRMVRELDELARSAP